MNKDITHEDDSVNNVMKVDESYQIPNIWSSQDSTTRYFNTYAKIIDELLTDPAGMSNKFPLALSFPVEMHHTMDIQMPKSWNMDIDKLHIKNNSYEFIFEATVDGSLISLKIFPPHI